MLECYKVTVEEEDEDLWKINISETECHHEVHGSQIENLDIIVPMEKLLKKDGTFCWNDDCKESLDILKEKMVTASILVFLYWKKEFDVHVDASCIALGAVLTQVGGKGLDYPIAFATCRLCNAEKNYSTTGCEWLAMVYALQNYQHYLLGGHFKMYTDHFALKYLVNKHMLGGENL